MVSDNLLGICLVGQICEEKQSQDRTFDWISEIKI